MRRFLIFGLLGPVLGFVLIRYGFLSSTVTGLDIHELTLMPLAYYFGLVPALLAAIVDHGLSERGVPFRPLWTAGIAFLLGYLPLLGVILYLGAFIPLMLLWGLVGAIPALICSALCGRSKRPSSLPGSLPPSSDPPTPAG